MLVVCGFLGVFHRSHHVFQETYFFGCIQADATRNYSHRQGTFCTATRACSLRAHLVIFLPVVMIFRIDAPSAPLVASVRVADFLRNHAQMARIRLFLFPLALRLALRASSCCTKQPSVLRVLLERSQLQVF